MRKFVFSILALVLFAGITMAQAQTSTGGTDTTTKADKKAAKAEKKEAKAAAKGKALTLTGWVKTEGDKTVFTNDKDKQDWTVSNPDTVKAEEGKHVKVKGTLDEANKSINVASVKELGKRKQSGETKAMKKGAKS